MNADEREQLANTILAGVGDGFCALLSGPEGEAWCRMFLNGEASFLVEFGGITAMTPDDLGDRLEAEVRFDE